MTRQKFRIPENDRPRLDSWVWKQKHGWGVRDSIGEGYWLCKICHSRRSLNKRWFKSFKLATRAGDHMKAEHRMSAEGEIPRLPEHYKKRKLDQYLKGYTRRRVATHGRHIPRNYRSGLKRDRDFASIARTEHQLSCLSRKTSANAVDTALQVRVTG